MWVPGTLCCSYVMGEIAPGEAGRRAFLLPNFYISRLKLDVCALARLVSPSLDSVDAE